MPRCASSSAANRRHPAPTIHFSTGNYNEVTARLYSDCCFLTCDEDLAADATAFFNAITGYSQPRSSANWPPPD